MLRTIIGGLIGIAVGLACLAGWGIVDGLTVGLPSAKLAPGLEAAATCAFTYTVFLSPIAVILGAAAGSIGGFGCWLVSIVSRSNL